MLALLVVASSLVTQQTPVWNRWTVRDSTGSYVADTAGHPASPSGARVSLRPRDATTAANGSISLLLPADTLRLRRMVVTGEVRAAGRPNSSALILLNASNPIARTSTNANVRLTPADSQWSTRELQLIISRTTTQVMLGITALGGSEIEVRNLRMVVRDLPAATTPLSDVARAELDSALSIVRRSAYWRDTVTWSAVEPDVRAFAAGAQTAADVYPAIRELLLRLGDHHSFLMPAQQATQWQSGTLVKNPLPTVRVVDTNVGYISVPAYSGGDPASAREYTNGTHQLLTGVTSAASCGWILDLRQNGGGNMWPMLAGLKPFLGNAKLGTFDTGTGSSPPWIAGQAVGVEPPANLMSLDSSAVAVLIGPRTSSSGEAVAVAFHGRARTRLFGQPTMGLANANSNLRLPDGAMMLVMTAVDVDRNGKKFGEKVEPDQMIPATTGNADDAAIAAAVRWLASQPTCRRAFF